MIRVLLALETWQYGQIDFAPSFVEVLPPIRLSDEGLSGTNLNYGDIATLTLPPLLRDYVAWQGWATVSSGLRVPVDPRISVQQHAAYIWRCQFEELAALNAGVCTDSPRDRRFEDFRTRWTGSSRVPTTRKFMNDDGWLAISHALWFAAVRVAQEWGDYLVASIQTQTRPTISEAWLARLGRWELRTASPVGLARTTNAAGWDELHPFVC